MTSIPALVFALYISLGGAYLGIKIKRTQTQTWWIAVFTVILIELIFKYL